MKDPFILMSMINMKLRDGDYESLSHLCDALGYDEKEVLDQLSAAGFEYNPELKQFR